MRPVRLENEQSVPAVQLYDIISGGAGFASSAPLHIEAVLKGMVKQLGCRHCDTACSECLLDSQTRHDHDQLDRKAAQALAGGGFQSLYRFAGGGKFSPPTRSIARAALRMLSVVPLTTGRANSRCG